MRHSKIPRKDWRRGSAVHQESRSSDGRRRKESDFGSDVSGIGLRSARNPKTEGTRGDLEVKYTGGMEEGGEAPEGWGAGTDVTTTAEGGASVMTLHLDVVGVGGSSRVFVGNMGDGTAQEMVAVKVVRKTVENRRQLEEEVAVMKKLSESRQMAIRRSVLPLLAALQTSTHVMLVMPFMRGGDLFSWLRKTDDFLLSTTKYQIASIVSALDFVHSHDIVYADLKPENVLLDETGRIFLADFGVSRSLKGTAGHNSIFVDPVSGRKRVKVESGSLMYASPARVMGLPIGSEEDYWALGVLLFEILMGRPLFEYKKELQDEAIRQVCCLDLMPLLQEVHEKIMCYGTAELLWRLLRRSPHQRLGCNGAHEVINHGWFVGFNFQDLQSGRMLPPTPTFFPRDLLDNVDNAMERVPREFPEAPPEASPTIDEFLGFRNISTKS